MALGVAGWNAASHWLRVVVLAASFHGLTSELLGPKTAGQTRREGPKKKIASFLKSMIPSEIRNFIPPLIAAKPTNPPSWEKGGPCRKPNPEDKMIWVVQHGDAPYGYEEKDGRLYPESVALAKNARNDPRFLKAFGPNMSERPQLVIMAPSRKAMEYALVAFADLLPNATWQVDSRIRGVARDGKLDKELGISLLNEFNQTRLVEEYSRKFDNGVHGGHELRWHDFLDELRGRPEQRIILVTHQWNCEITGMDMGPGEVRIANLLSNPPEDDLYGGNAWRQLSIPRCWDLPETNDNSTRNVIGTWDTP